MGSEWTDESVIRRDLSLAQGQWVPCGINAVVAGEKPPTQVLAEETEEEYYKNWTADGDFSTGPDLCLIKKMLEMVHDGSSEDEDDCSPPVAEIEIRKVTTLSSKIKLPLVVTTKTIKPKEKPVKPKEKPVKPRRARNAAIASLLAIQQTRDLALNNVNNNLKLSKPEDFVIKVPALNKDDTDASKRKNESVKKVNNWLHAQNSGCMFKRKSKNSENKENDIKTPSLNVASGQNFEKSYIKTVSSGGSYTPSSFASEYYQTCVKRSHMQQLVEENIWARAEKVMKEIDERKADEIRKHQEVEETLNIILEAAEDQIAKKSEENEDPELEQEPATKELTDGGTTW